MSIIKKVLSWLGLRSVKEDPYPPYEVYTLKEFVESVTRYGVFSEIDGSGFYGTLDYESSQYVFTANGTLRLAPMWCTHVYWYPK